MYQERRPAVEMDKALKDDLTPNKKCHVLLLPFPVQGHINPILQFGKRLASKGLRITFATSVYLSKSMHLNDFPFEVELFSDGFDEVGPSGAATGKIFLKTSKETGSRTLSSVINKYNNSGCPEYQPITCLVCDTMLPWALDVGKQFGLVTAAFYTQPCGVNSIFYHVTQGHLSVPVEEPIVSLPGLPELVLQDLPSSITKLEPELPALELLLGQFSNTDKSDWLLFNTFDQLESELLKLMGEIGRVRAIGPAISSMYLDNWVEGDVAHNLNVFKPSDDDYITWLNGKEAGSVLYISFGSLAELGEEQMEELSSGIRQSNKDFVWVVREKERSKLPEGFAEEMLGKGLLVPWCSQLQVLAHEAIGCFLTHCGWNSTIEALSLGVPMVAMPHLWDQFTNAKFIADVWGIGVRVKIDDKGIVRKEELNLSIKEVMEGETGKVIKSNAADWREKAKEAVDAGGSSDLNIDEFVDSLTCS